MDPELLKLFDEKQATALLAIVKKAQDDAVAEAEKRLSTRLTEDGIVENEFLGITKADRKILAERAEASRLKEIWDNHGVNPRNGRKYSVEDMIGYDRQRHSVVLADTQFPNDQPFLIQQVVTEFVREAIEPRLVLSPLLQSIAYQHGTKIVFPATSAFYAEDVAVGTEYPEMELEWAGMVEATIGKVGIAVKMSEEMIKHSMYDIMAIHLREAGKALARHKERKVANLLSSVATTVFDNDAGTPTTGTDVSGAANGTFLLEDLLTMVSTAINAGWQPNTIIMNPMAWIIFARDPVMRDFGFQNGRAMWQNVQGQPGAAPQWKGQSLVRPWKVSDPQQLATTYTPIPEIFPFGTFNIILSPFIAYNGSTLKTDIYVCDASEIGYMVVEEGVMTETWKDPAHELQKTKFREKYSVVGAIDPRVLVAKNVSIAKSYDWYQRGSWQFGTGIPGA